MALQDRDQDQDCHSLALVLGLPITSLTSPQKKFQYQPQTFPNFFKVLQYY